MPKLKQSWYRPQNPPPIDWLWAALLERKMVYGYDLKTMAKVAGVSYEMMRKYSRMNPWDWPRSVRVKVCEHFGINLMVTPKDIELTDEARYKA